MKTILLKQGGKETSFIYEDYELEFNEHGTISTITFYKGNGNTENFVQVQCTNKATNLSTIDAIIMKKIVKTGINDTYMTIPYDSIVIKGKSFFKGQSEAELQQFVKSPLMPLMKSKVNEIVKSVKQVNAPKQSTITKTADTKDRQSKLNEYVQAQLTKKKAVDSKQSEKQRQTEIIKSVKQKLNANRGIGEIEFNEAEVRKQVDGISKLAATELIKCVNAIEKSKRQMDMGLQLQLVEILKMFDGLKDEQLIKSVVSKFLTDNKLV